MKKLIVYYSLDGNTAFIAKAIAGAVEADVLELKLSDETLYQGVLKKYFLGGRDAATKKTPALMPLVRNPRDYDVLFIGTPVWAWTYCPALASFFSQEKIENKKIALFCCHSGGMGKTLDQMKERLTGNSIIGQTDFKDPLRLGKAKAAELAIQWAREALSKP